MGGAEVSTPEGRALVLLGAGASREAEIPTTVEMTPILVKKVAKGWQHRHAAALHFVCGALLAYDAASGASPFDSLDVERVFAAVELLAERRSLEVTPFVAAWHPAVDTWDVASPPEFFDRDLSEALLREIPGFRVRELITKLVESVVGLQSTGQTYSALADRMIDELRDLVALTDKEVEYLGPLVQHGSAPGGLTIATLNYDLSIEHAARAAGIPVTTGIDGWISSGRWSWPRDPCIRLLKLHGSIDWVWAQSEHVEGHFPRRTLSVSEEPGARQKPALVFGQRGKLRADGPFLGLLAEFERQLAESTRLIAIGYSFRDDHVNELITRWAAEDASRTILVVDPAWPTLFDEDFRRDLQRYLIPPDDQPELFRPRLRVWPLRCSEALLLLRQAAVFHGPLDALPEVPAP